MSTSLEAADIKKKITCICWQTLVQKANYKVTQGYETQSRKHKFDVRL